QKFKVEVRNMPRFDQPGRNGPNSGVVEFTEVPADQAQPKVPFVRQRHGFIVPNNKQPQAKAPAFKIPEFKMPDIKPPDTKVPKAKVPEFKPPEVKPPIGKTPRIPFGKGRFGKERVLEGDVLISSNLSASDGVDEKRAAAGKPRHRVYTYN